MSLPSNHGQLGETLASRLIDLGLEIDGATIAPQALLDGYERLTAELAGFSGSRVALLASRTDRIFIALAAAEAAGCELALARMAVLPPALAEAWQVAATIGADGEIRATGVTSAGECRFNVLIASSGTTGEPKLARHSIHSLFGRIRQPEAAQQRPRWLLTYHPATFGGLQVLLTVLASGGEILTLTQPSAEALARLAVDRHPTHVSGTPTFWRSFLLALGSGAPGLPLKRITLGGEIADQNVLDRLRAAFPGAAITHIYASTEAGALFAVRDARAGFPAAWLETGIDGVRLRIRDDVLQVLSPRAMSSYLNRDTAGVVTGDGWLNTGDIVELSADRVFFRGRRDLLLNVGGAKVRPEEVEAALDALPEVAESRVYGIANPVTGMLVAAEIVPAAGGDPNVLRRSILQQLRARLEPYKVPRIVKLVDSIAVSAAGKKGRVER
jgi:acyl-CoA synthetase (AMP-forming)/AMP-acid ligase II